jgi:hypothetical protein
MSLKRILRSNAKSSGGPDRRRERALRIHPLIEPYHLERAISLW